MQQENDLMGVANSAHVASSAWDRWTAVFLPACRAWLQSIRAVSRIPLGSFIGIEPNRTCKRASQGRKTGEPCRPWGRIMKQPKPATLPHAIRQ